MELGVGLDGTLNLSFTEEARVVEEAARLGYTSVWTPEGAGYDSFLICAHRWAASRSVVPEGLTVGISVSPVALRTPISLAMSGGTVSSLTGGRFILGIGSGGIYTPAGRRPFGLPKVSSLDVMRDYLTTVRSLVRGEEVIFESPAVKLRNVRLGITPPPGTPVYLGALGPSMLRLGGGYADGVALNWCTPEHRAWSRAHITEGARDAGRDSGDVRVIEYIRVCIDNDESIAKQAFANALIGYALGQPGSPRRPRGLGYRSHFERLGFGDTLSQLDRMRDAGASTSEMADVFPPEQLRQVGYYGPATGAPEALRGLFRGLDIAIVRVVAARPGVESVLSTLRACRPELTGS